MEKLSGTLLARLKTLSWGKSLPLLVLLLITLIPPSLQQSNNPSYLEETFTDSLNNGQINHIVVHELTGKIYVSAVNTLHQLTENLAVEKSVRTGPKEDSPNCPAEDPCTCSSANCEMYERRPTDAINKALLIDYKNERLIACFNIFQGHCERRFLRDISSQDELMFKPMVPMDEVSPAVMLIAPGPEREDVLYIGATRSTIGMGVYRDLIPAMSSRDLATWELVEKTIAFKTEKEIEIQHRDTFRILFKSVFSSNGFTYFLSVQKNSVEMGNIEYGTKIVRVCQKDKKFYSYTEIPLQCFVGDINYNILMSAYVTRAGADLARSLGLAHMPPFSEREDVLFAVFARSESYSSQPLADSALCVFPMQKVQQVFTSTIQACFMGVGNTGPTHMVTPFPCDPTDLKITDEYCGDNDINHPIAGTTPVKADASLQFATSLLTSITVAITHQYTVAFLGTDNGYIKKVVIESGESAKEYESFVVEEGSRVNADLHMNRAKTHLYVTTEKQVTRVRVQDCGRYTTCGDCLGAHDPYCGWCSLEKKCSIRRDCPQAEDPLRWLPYSNAQCTKILQVLPQQVQIQRHITEGTLLSLTIQNLPEPSNGEYQCAFSGYGVMRTTTATRLQLPAANSDGGDSGAAAALGFSGTAVNNTLTCETPMPNLLPPIPTGLDHVVMKLSVRMNSKDFVSTNFTFFDCSRHTSCTDCTQSDYPCTWCVDAHQCTHDRESCLTDILVTGKNVPGFSDRPGPEYCPRIEASFTQILVPSGTQKEVTVKAINLQDTQDDFRCEFSVDGGHIVPATKTSSNMIKCNAVIFEYRSTTSNLNVPFKILWGTPAKKLDNPDNIQVKVYKCEAMASNCGSCLTINATYGCGWCGNQCTIQSQCPGQGTWLDNTAICPNPTITSFTPSTGPRAGGTNVTIVGENLGKIYDDIKNGVSVADIPCRPFAKQYEPSKSIVCETGRSSRVTKGQVEVVVNNKFRGLSQSLFRYVRPKIHAISPGKGPQSGGTRLTISGEHVNTGTRITASVLEQPCEVISTTESEAVCVSPAMTGDSDRGSVEMYFDLDHVTNNDLLFHYVPDPNISLVVNARGIISGGTSLLVNGQHLDSIQDPKMVLYVGEEEYIGDCSKISPQEMNCTAPSVQASNLGMLKIEPESPVLLSYGFLLDNVVALKNYTKHSVGAGAGPGTFALFPNPVFEQFPEDGKMFQAKNDYLTINGENLDWALTEADLRVMIGEEECEVTTVSKVHVICKPADTLHSSSHSSHMVMIYLGSSNLSYPIGQLQLEGEQSILDIIKSPVGIGVFCGGVFLVFFIIIMVLLYFRKMAENSRKMKSMQNQMDLLEAKVAHECKEAFAELQTDMTELTSDLSGSQGIPFRDYRSFTMHVLFPNSHGTDHPVTRPPEADLVRQEAAYEGYKIFDQLIGNKTFLLLFIRCLEKQSDFSMRDRVNVASLISVALQNRMDYHCDILKTLLEELIEKSVEGRHHPKLLLRRTESVAEKMLTNWFTFLLYKFLKECAGGPLFMLYRAIKQQVDKGPVDAVTSEAKYSLSEDKLIRQQIDYKILSIHLENPVPLVPLPSTQTLDPDLQYGAQDHMVKVLDCDTITQVKEKILDAIYKNQRFSDRPDKDSLDLEWRRGGKRDMLLQDEDGTTRVEGEYKRYNTLAHYGVPEGAQLALVPRQRNGSGPPDAANASTNASLYNLTFQSGRSDSHHRLRDDPYATYTGSPSLNRTLSPRGGGGGDVSINMVDRFSSAKCYHLVKPSDVDHHHKDGGDRGSKMVSEIYLTRLLATKGTLQSFVDDLFETIFSTNNRSQCLPLAIKYMFDFLDDQALFHNIIDPEVVHTWKSNSLPLRFWVNVIKNPEFVFDISKSNIVDACLSVVAQTFMDSCTTSKHELSKDSPSCKLLYAKDIPKYKKWVERYYKDVKEMPAISDQDMSAILAEESRGHQNEFNLTNALKELYMYASKYHKPLIESLEEDEFARNNQLVHKLHRVRQHMVSE